MTSLVAQQITQLGPNAADDEVGDAWFVHAGEIHCSTQDATAVRDEVGEADNASGGQHVLGCRRDGIVGAGADCARTDALSIPKMHTAVPSAGAYEIDRNLKQ